MSYQEALQRIRNAEKKQTTELDLQGLGLTELPPEIGKLTNLTMLYLSGNNLSEFPPGIVKLTNLTLLFLFNNKLSEFPPEIVNLTNLTSLNLAGNNLSELPPEIGNLTNLTVLNLIRNGLSQLPPEIGKLTSLKSLNLAGNTLSQLPPQIGKLTNLTSLDLSGNNLSELPPEIGKLTNLTSLDLEANNLSELPPEIGKLTNLTLLFLHDNPRLDIPVEVLGPTWIETIEGKGTAANPRDILDYYFRTRKTARPLNEGKIILVGRGGAGKSSLVERLLHPEKEFKEGKEPTPGISIQTWELRINADDIRLNVWDFGGQEIMHGTHQFFLTERTLYLLVLTGREDSQDADAEYWLEFIESFGGDSPVIVIQNQIKKHRCEVKKNELLRKYGSRIKGFIETDCKEAYGIPDLLTAIKRETDALDGIHAKFPAEWFELKDAAGGMKENFLTFTEFAALCAEKGVKNESDQKQLSKFLHQLGIALNYGDDRRLHDTHVLKPKWITEGIYDILNYKPLQDKGGEIEISRLGEILDKEAYPKRTHNYIFDLMAKFELCFSLDSVLGRYLIPELLPKDEPALDAGLDLGSSLKFEYDYTETILPPGLLPRFIVRTNNLSGGLARWRSGVMLNFDGCTALVRADHARKKVEIFVCGKSAKKRVSLLAIIRSGFDAIHGDIRISPERMVPLPGYPGYSLRYDDLVAFESNGINEYPVNIEGRVIKFDVIQLLNGVDEPSARKKEAELRKFGRYDDGSRPQSVTYVTHIYGENPKAVIGPQDSHIEMGSNADLLEKIGEILGKLNDIETQMVSRFADDVVARIQSEPGILNSEELAQIDGTKKGKWETKIKTVIPLIPKIPFLGEFFPSLSLETTRTITTDDFINGVRKFYGGPPITNLLDAKEEDPGTKFLPE